MLTFSGGLGLHVCEVHSGVLISALISGAHGTITTPESSELLTTIFTKFFLVVFQYIYIFGSCSANKINAERKKNNTKTQQAARPLQSVTFTVTQTVALTKSPVGVTRWQMATSAGTEHTSKEKSCKETPKKPRPTQQ